MRLRNMHAGCRWIGMSPRRIAQPHTYAGLTFQPEDRVFFMFSWANRDEDHFENRISLTSRAMWLGDFVWGGTTFCAAPDIQGDDCRWPYLVF